MVPHDPGTDAEPAGPHAPRGVVTVVGDAVIDHIYRTEQIPSPGSWVSGHFDARVGGKGLNRAVAAARLGLQVRFVSIVGDDDGGRRILEYLDREGVDTEFVKVGPGATPVTAALVAENGDSAFIGGLVGAELDRRDLLSAITSSDVVLLTFGLPAAVLEAVLSILPTTADRPRVLVHPAPPLDPPEGSRRLRAYFDKIDYLIGTPWHLDRLMLDDPAVAGESGANIAQRACATLGVRCVCAVEHFACTVRSDDLRLDIPASPLVVLDDSPGAGAAFAAALAYRLVATGQLADRRDFEWATAAMAATESYSGFPDSMPTVGDIDRIIAGAR
ncbi:PfkB family carbohydrate kinase [Nocardia sp. NPDC052112]|uniref:PfkB family carbohydrate kinase n=1 Tax=Nocardia sp. NPDC052112 TaxID=3155646 RepID=UPI00343B702B